MERAVARVGRVQAEHAVRQRHIEVDRPQLEVLGRAQASTPRFIETIPKRGYRFLADVHPVEPADRSTVQEVPSVVGTRFRPVQALWVAALAVAVPALAIRNDWLPWTIARSERPSGSLRSLAVLPFRPLVADTRDEALEMGLAEAVTETRPNEEA